MKTLKPIQMVPAKFTIAFLILALAGGCGPLKEDLNSVDFTPLVREDWPVSTPEEQGLDSRLVAEAFLDADEQETLYSLLIIKNGYLVAEDYFNEGSVDQKDRLQSVTKSFPSSVIWEPGSITAICHRTGWESSLTGLPE